MDDETGLWLRARLDRVCYRDPDNRTVIAVDWKTTRAYTARTFAKDIAEFGYHRQAAWYCSALEALGFSSREEVPALIETAFHHSEYDWVVSAIFAMGRSCDKRWQEPVVKMLDHVLPAVRTVAARAAGEIEISDARERLIELLEDDNDDARMAATWSLSQIGGEGVQEALDLMLAETEDPEQADLVIYSL